MNQDTRPSSNSSPKLKRISKELFKFIFLAIVNRARKKCGEPECLAVKIGTLGLTIAFTAGTHKTQPRGLARAKLQFERFMTEGSLYQAAEPLI